ncbi:MULTISPECIES: UDP-N-acetylglucosamine--undecaprenyl-phosphate N-acetylglucosaminephosphotransferase [Pseudoalteromonas]|uniref:UDP-N-acetylglucosamine--undecaprenyl-phosphate N-acetylglucosaminephosphotransferase n=1 Tax=Pseudoalteromonas TaxID=53246 RepID=UPI0002F3B09A|nr:MULTISPECIES: UDP-N-acetylglucosamine--undecaprenyl-phosphate N-acetylglucosaminephosphotransferase [Pseudoalteromonas]MCF2825861.1 UDP-N-acetylglucosamine--undecaprenyl-phosphate N-acetylglucosaminephosphotransferase [Pseudoalteromonas sp. OF5H-5]MCF2832622.1 UDP-N-acetylglucosamine--undecaprenyl-phosphate N-acetylglucosaminephosphotransferase [Pseudoalteromonas sp. DL2-H6]MCF2927269.1 UDP-N-acetylglucosamine--undecaprenyl-phosphate N-acetylglucosaminephosphotransferase [Pseudoalteromonas sp
MLALLFSFAMSLAAIGVVRPMAIRFNLVDKPNERKKHEGHIPLIGGIAVFSSIFITSSLFFPFSIELGCYLLASGLMVLIGVMDDKHDLSVRFRIFFQIVVASLMIFSIDSYIQNLGDLFSFGDINLGWFGVLFTYVAVIGIINAFNMVDGIDGLLGTMAIITLSAISILLFLSGQENLLSVLLVVALVPYLIFNLGAFGTQYKKIFMGDAGSMFIGFTVVWLLAINTQGATSSFRPVTALWIVAVPLMDMAAIIIRRIRKGKSPFSPDRDHLHHIFLRAGFNSRQALLVISLIGALFASIGVAGELFEIPESVMFVAFIGIFLVYNYAILHVWRILKWYRKHRA